MSRFRLPTQQGTELFPVVIKQPVRVRFDGVPPRTPEARELFDSLQGEIDAFYTRASHATSLGIIEQRAQYHRGPGFSMEYHSLQGIETIYVKVSAERHTRVVKQVREDPRLPRPLTPKLAIDVLFKAKELLVGDISSHEGGSEGGDWHDPNDWELVYGSPQGDAWFTGPQMPSYDTAPAWYWSDDNGLADSGQSGYQYYPDADFWQPVNFGTPGPALAPYIVRTRRQTGDGAIRFWAVERLYLAPAAPTKFYTRKEYRYLNTVNVAGVIDTKNPEDRAISTGESVGQIRTETEEELTTIEREVGVEDEITMGTTGYGFLVELPTTSGEVHEYAVYVASENITVKNAYPEGQEARFETDHPSFTYDVDREVTFTVRVREFDTASTPEFVKVELDTTMSLTTFTTDEPDTPPPGPGEKEIIGKDTTSPGGGEEGSGPSSVPLREVSWTFAADKKWTDQGGEPADPEAPGMGKLLAETEETTVTVAGVPTDERKVLHAPKWDEKIEDMTRVATITWTPSTKDGVPGTAKIELVGA